MLKRGYMILIAGASLFAIGIALTVAYGLGMASTFLDGTVMLDNVEIGPSESVNHTLEVDSLDRPISVALHMESDANSNLETNNQPILEQLVVNPDEVVINKNQLSENTQSELLTTFKPETEGTFTLTLSNLGTESVTVGGFFGFLPVSGEDGQVNFDAFTGVAAGVIIFIIGAITIIAGTIIAILDRRKNRNTTRPSFDWGR